MDKRIITWKWGNNETRDEFTTTRAFLFGNYGDNFAHYSEMVEEAKKSFPDLENEEITCSKVTNSTYMKGFAVISFLLPDNTKKEGWEDWDKFDFNY